MGYSAFSGPYSTLKVRPSKAESRASGLRVGRLDVWPPNGTSPREVVGLIEVSGFDVVIVRVSTNDGYLVACLDSGSYTAWPADVILYFKADSSPFDQNLVTTTLVRQSPEELTVTDELVQRIFSDYRNHYAANPVFSRVSVVGAYRDWIRQSIADPKFSVLKSVNMEGEVTGLCLLESDGQTFVEVLLAGIVPDHRRQGCYQGMLRAICGWAHDHGKSSVVISTQSSNIAAMRAWCRLGFLPELSLATIHVVRRDIQMESLQASQGT